MKEEITKEIKNIEELEDKPNEEKEDTSIEEEIEELTEETKEEPSKEEPKEVKKDKKKIILIVSGIILGVLLLIVLLVLLLPKKKDTKIDTEEPSESNFVTVIKQSIKDDTFDDTIKDALKKNDLSTEVVYLLSLDIDSDEAQELVAYAEGNNKKYILQFEIDEEITLEDSFPVDTKESLGYAYSSERASNYWFSIFEKNYTIISSAKKIIKEEDFISNYYILTTKYKENNILDNTQEYKFDSKLDVEQLEKNQITNDKLLKDNNIDKDTIKDSYSKYVSDKKEQEAKEKQEAEEKERLEEEQRKLAGSLIIGKKTYKYGKYTIYTPDGEIDGEITLYSDLTCIYKGNACTYTLGEVRGNNSELTPGLALSTGNIFITTEDEGVLVEPATANLVKYTG